MPVGLQGISLPAQRGWLLLFTVWCFYSCDRVRLPSLALGDASYVTDQLPGVRRADQLIARDIVGDDKGRMIGPLAKGPGWRHHVLVLTGSGQQGAWGSGV